MLIPWGHDSSQIRRRPWVTYGLAGVCLLAFIVTSAQTARPWAEADQKLEEAFNYWQAHPYLEGNDRLTRQFWDLGDDDFAYWEEETGGIVPDALTIEVEQAELRILMTEEREIRATDPWMQFGLVPDRPQAAGLFAHMFMHAGWLHLLGNLWFLILSGPYIEDRFGRGLFLTFYLASGLAGAALFAGLDGSGTPLIGASGAVSGVLGAFLVCSMRIKIKFFYWIIWPGTFSAPAWMMLPLWFASELVSALSAPSGDPVAYWAHVGGFGFGAVAAFAIRRAGVEGMLSRELGQLDPETGSPLLDATRLAIREGRLDEAISGASDALADGNADPAAVTAYLEAVHAAGRECDVAPTLVEHFWSAVEWRKKDAAIALWEALAAQNVTPSGRGEPLLQVSGWLRGAGMGGEANVAMKAALAVADPALAVRIARAARRHDPVLVTRAADRVLAAPEVAGPDRKAMQALRGEARKEASRRGWILLEAGDRVEKGRGRAVRVPVDPPQTVRVDRSSSPAAPASDYEDEILGNVGEDAGADLFDAKVAAVPSDDSDLDLTGNGATEEATQAFSAASGPSSLAPGEAIDISDILGESEEAPVRLPDPQVAGTDAFLDSLHASLESDGLADGQLLAVSEEELTDEPPSPDLGHTEGMLFEAAGTDLAGDLDSTALDLRAQPPDPLSASGADTRVMSSAESGPASEAESSVGMEAAGSTSLDEDFVVLDAEKEEEPAPRRLQVMTAVPLGLDATHVTLDVEGRGRSRLALERIDAVSSAGVGGLSDTGKPVLVIDLCLNWTGHDDLQLVRLRSDGFDPRRLVDAEGSSLKALRALAALLVLRCRGVSLPPETEPDPPFRIYPDAETYQREVLRVTC